MTPRLIVCAPEGERGLFELPASRVGRTPEFPSGGERSLYELAIAAAASGFDVELRGRINRTIFEELTMAAGARPSVSLPPRRAEPGDVVVVPEVADSALIGAVQLTGAAGVVAMLAPPGLFGSSWQPGWTLPDPVTVDVESVGRPESFAAWSALGFTLWTNAQGIADAAARSDVAMEWLGTGTPLEAPAPAEKTHDLAIVVANRWARLAEEMAGRVEGASVLRVGPTPSTYSLAAELAPARILIWPTRVEGMSRIAREARSVGTVPVALNINPFATAADFGEGCVLVPDADALVDAAVTLLRDPERLAELGAEGIRSVRQQTEWAAYVARVEGAVKRLADPPDAVIRAGIGDQIWSGLATLEQQVAFQRDRADAGAADLAGSRQEVAALRAEVERTVQHAAGLESALEAAKRERDEAVRRGAATALVADQAERLATELEAAQSELEAFRDRLVVRLADGSAAGRAWAAARSRRRSSRRLPRPSS